MNVLFRQVEISSGQVEILFGRQVTRVALDSYLEHCTIQPCLHVTFLAHFCQQHLWSLLGYPMIFFTYARFICTIYTCWIRWSCEGLTSVTQQIHWIHLKHLLLRHMYNLSLLNLMCYSTRCSALTESVLAHPLTLVYSRLTDFALYCAVPYIAACVDVSERCFGTVHLRFHFSL